MLFFRKKTTQEQVDKALYEARLRWEKDKKVEFDKFYSLWENNKEKDVDKIKQAHREDIAKKDRHIMRLKKQIVDQKNAFRKFKDLAIQNEVLSTQLSTESEAFLNMTSKISGVFALLKYRAEKINKSIEKKEDRETLLKYMDDFEESDLTAIDID
jgi:hypothetical protein